MPAPKISFCSALHGEKYIADPGLLVSPAVGVRGWCKPTPDLDPMLGSHGFNWSSVCKWVKFYIFRLSHKLTSHDLWPSFVTFNLMNMWRFQNCINKPCLFPIRLQLFKWGNFTFWAYFTTWPQMTFNFDMWPLTLSRNEGSHIASMTQHWLKTVEACGSSSQMLTCFHNRQQRT